MLEQEIEKSYLVTKLPEDLVTYPYDQIVDIYLPTDDVNKRTRLRKKNNKFVITKKISNPDDFSQSTEETIELTKLEYDAISQVKANRLVKHRYYYPYNGKIVEVDVFKEQLEGLVMAEVEFTSLQELESFTKPDFCGFDVTQEDFSVGVYLASVSYIDLEPVLAKLNYIKISL